MTLIHHDELPLDARQEVPVLHTHLVRGDDDGERGSGACSARSGRLAASLGGSYTGHGRWLKASRTELSAVVWIAVIHKNLGGVSPAPTAKPPKEHSKVTLGLKRT
jgi:hypothetical protein